MDRDDIADDVKRFLLVRVGSIPQLEAILLLRKERQRAWDSKQVAARLYVSDKVAADLLADLQAGGILVIDQDQPTMYRYQPQLPELAQMLDRLATVYASNLVSVTNLIHSKTSKNAQRFADAFIWRKDT